MDCKLHSGMRFSILGRTFKYSLDEYARTMGLTGVQLMVMAQLHRLEASGMAEIRQRDLENAAHLSHPTMTELLKKLEKKGFVECAVCPSDRRSKLIRSTPCARAFREEMDSVDRAVYAQLCCDMSESEQKELERLLDMMLARACAMRKDVFETHD